MFPTQSDLQLLNREGVCGRHVTIGTLYFTSPALKWSLRRSQCLLLAESQAAKRVITALVDDRVQRSGQNVAVDTGAIAPAESAKPGTANLCQSRFVERSAPVQNLSHLPGMPHQQAPDFPVHWAGCHWRT